MRVIGMQKAVGGRQKSAKGTPASGHSLPSALCLPPSARTRGFTLMEMLIVMGIIILALAMAVPTIRALTGSKSQSAAQNTVSAFLARTRAEAIGLQQAEGVLFYIDPITDRVVLTQVQETPLDTSDPPYSGAAYLDLVPDRDNLVLPSGIRLQTLTSPAKNPTGDPSLVYPNDRYIGFNTTTVKDNHNTASATAVGGVILFDSAGRLTNRYYLFRTEVNQAGSGVQTAMGQLLKLGKNETTYSTLNNTVPQGLRSSIGFVLFDKEAFQNGGGTDADPTAATGAETTEETWLDNNTTPILIDRYNGTLIIAE